MITFKIKRNRFQFRRETVSIPTSWDELTVDQIVKLSKCKSNEDVFRLITGLDFSLYGQVSPYLDFINVPYRMDQIEIRDLILIGSDFFQVPNIRNCTFGQKMLFKSKLQEVKESNVMESISYLVSIYLIPTFDVDSLDEYAGRISMCSAFDVYGVYLNLIDQFESLIERESKALAVKHDPISEMAGAKNFNKFGDFNTVDRIAQKYNYKHSEVEALEYEVVFLMLYLEVTNINYKDSYKNFTNLQNNLTK